MLCVFTCGCIQQCIPGIKKISIDRQAEQRDLALSCFQPSYGCLVHLENVPTSLVAYKALGDLALATSAASLHIMYHFSVHAQATLVSLLFLASANFCPATGPLISLFLCLECSSFCCEQGQSCYCVGSQIKNPILVPGRLSLTTQS